jgi:hypothetical protein
MPFFIVVLHLIVSAPSGNIVVTAVPDATVYGNLKQCRQAAEALRAAVGKDAPEIGCLAVELKGEHDA